MDKTLKARNYSVDIIRYVCALLVVAIHTHPVSDFSEVGGIICTQIIPRIAVPFFFSVSGYYYIRKLVDGKQPFAKYFIRLVLIYSVCSVPYIVYNYFVYGRNDAISYLKDSLANYFFSGTFYHFWYFPALLFSVLITTVAYKLLKKRFNIVIWFSILLYIIGCLGCSYYQIGICIPIINRIILSPYFELIRRVLLMGFPFFVSGYVVLKLENILKSISSAKLRLLWLVSFITWIIEIIVVIYFDLQENIVLTICLYFYLITTFLLLLRDPWCRFEELSRKCKVIANITFYIHPLMIILLQYIIEGVLKITLTETLLFISVCILSTILGLLGYKCCRRNRYVKYFFG